MVKIIKKKPLEFCSFKAYMALKALIIVFQPLTKDEVIDN